MDEKDLIRSDFVQLSRLAASGLSEDVRLFLAKTVRKYRRMDPELANQVDGFLKVTRGLSPAASPLRRASAPTASAQVPTDSDSRMALLRAYDDGAGAITPILSETLQSHVDSILRERQKIAALANHGLRPTRSAILVGPPGVGKTLTARWIASQLKRPLWVLDLSTVMSSLLGRTGGNVRAALDYVKEHEGVLLLDEIDALAKHRNDDTDIGELKRLVAVLLQEIDNWPDASLLLAATNHPELIDRALWRRFDAVLDFGLPSDAAVAEAIDRFLGTDKSSFAPYVGSLAALYRGMSLSDIERALGALRRAKVLHGETAEDATMKAVKAKVETLDRSQRKELAFAMAAAGMTYHEITRFTGVARDTLRRHAGPSRTPRGRR